MLSAGEVSGDIHGAALAKELKKSNSALYLFGMGGEKMRLAGVDIKYDLSAKGTVGIMEVIKFLPSILFGLAKMKKLLKKEKPDILTLIDYQGFNMLLAKYAKKLGIKTVYYIAPQEWLWGTPKGIKNVVETIDKLLCIFEEEAKIYKENGGNAVYVGNPNIDTARPSSSKEDFCKTAGLNPKFPIFGLFPGSRHQELDALLPVFTSAAGLIKKRIPNAQFVIALSSLQFKTKVNSYLQKHKINIPALYGRSHDILSASNVAIAASGTIIMEAAIINTPAIMAYKISALTYLIAKHIVKIKLPYFTMPNIIANKMIVPEIMQSDATECNIAGKAVQMLTDPEEIKAIKEGFRLVRARLGAPGAVKRAAEEIMTELRGKI
ncbi:MAG: lipid-A-disaccharide synthase [Candidatus Margulisiibacteriota bacterium]